MGLPKRRPERHGVPRTPHQYQDENSTPQEMEERLSYPDFHTHDNPVQDDGGHDVPVTPAETAGRNNNPAGIGNDDVQMSSTLNNPTARDYSRWVNPHSTDRKDTGSINGDESSSPVVETHDKHDDDDHTHTASSGDTSNGGNGRVPQGHDDMDLNEGRPMAGSPVPSYPRHAGGQSSSGQGGPQPLSNDGRVPQSGASGTAANGGGSVPSPHSDKTSDTGKHEGSLGGETTDDNRNKNGSTDGNTGQDDDKPDKDNESGDKDSGVSDDDKDAAKEGSKNFFRNAAGNAVNNVKDNIKNEMLYGDPGSARYKAMQAANKAMQVAKNAKDTAIKAANATKKAAMKAVNTVKHIGAIIINLLTPPQVFIEAIVIVLVMVMLSVIGIVQTIGPSIIDCDVSGETSNSSNGNSSSSIPQDAGGDFKSETAIKVYEFLTKEMGFSGAGASGALAVAYRESNFRLDAQNAGGGVAGIFQWSGFSNNVNGSRITSEGSIKAGDVSTLTLENQLKLLRHELNGTYHNAKVTVGNATDPAQAAKDWSRIYEGVALTDGQSKVTQIEAWAKQACSDHDCSSVKADPAKLNEGGNGASDNSPGSSDGTSTDNAKEILCGLDPSKDGSAQAGVIGGGKECSNNGGSCDFSWLCNAMGVCKSGDSGPIPNPYGYQCVWYAWTRAAMVYKDSYGKQWNTILGNGGDIWANAKGQPGWTVDQTPKAGDIVSGYGGTFTGSGAYGHVAFVEKVENGPTGWRIFISEGNYNGSATFNTYNTRWLEGSQNPSLHFVRHSSWHLNDKA